MTTHTAETIKTAIVFTFFAASTTFAPLTKAEQISLFGSAPFGKKQVRHNARRGGVDVKTTTISRDYNIDFFSYAKLAELVNAGKAVEIQR